MPLNELGSAPANLQVASEAINRQQDRQAQKEDQTRLAIDQGSKLPNEMAQDQMKAQLDMITITPQLAQGATKATGDESWSKTVGSKMRADVYSALLALGAKNNAYSNLFMGDDGVYTIDRKTGEAVKVSNKGKEDLEDAKAKHKADSDAASAGRRDELEDRRHKDRLSEIDEAGKFKGKGGRGSGSGQDPEDKEFLKTYRGYMNDLKGFNGTLLQQMSKQQPERFKEYQDKIQFLQSNKSRFDQLQGLGKGDTPKPEDEAKKRSKAIDWLKTKYPKLTNPSDHDIEWALQNMNK